MAKILHDFILLDRSGSMNDKWKETLSSINAYVKELAGKEETKSTKITVVMFDKHAGNSTFDIIRDGINVASFLDLTEIEANPRGYTPLFDATVKLVNLAETSNPDNCCIVIMTDGQENSSIEATQATAKAALDRLRAKGWQVIFLGANFDNIHQAASLGTKFNQTISSSVDNMVESMQKTAALRYGYGVSGQSMSYSDEDRKKARAKQI